MANFWLNNGEAEKKMHWISWNQMTESKENGGMGFRELVGFNDTLICQQLWRLITQPNLLMSKVLKSKYFPHSNIFQAVSKPSDSWLWKSWLEPKYLLTEGCA